MITLVKNNTKKLIYNEPISKSKYIELLEKHPNGFYLNDGKKITHCNLNTDYKHWDVNIDFYNSVKVLGLIVGVFYSFVLKSKVKKIVTSNTIDTESYLANLSKEVEEVMKKKPTPVKKGRSKKSAQA